jgi:molecular chaperone GrpE
MQDSKPEPNQTVPAVVVQLGEEPDPTGLRNETSRLKEENEQLIQELRREHDMYVRNLADFDNYRRRAERERAQAAQAGKRQLVLPLLDVMDDFERALDYAQEDPQSVAVGFHAIHRRLSGLLAAEGVTAFESRGKSFNPLLHEAVGTVDSERAKPGTVSRTVVDELRRGWRWGDELLRPARVRVAE